MYSEEGCGVTKKIDRRVENTLEAIRWRGTFEVSYVTCSAASTSYYFFVSKDPTRRSFLGYVLKPRARDRCSVTYASTSPFYYISSMCTCLYISSRSPKLQSTIFSFIDPANLFCFQSASFKVIDFFPFLLIFF